MHLICKVPWCFVPLAFLVLSSWVHSGEAPVDPIYADRFEVPVVIDCPECPELMVIPGGSFTMGSPETEFQSVNTERPQREVDVPSFAMGRTSVTFDQWEACVAAGGCNHQPSDQGWGKGSRPVINVSWNDAQQYVAWLSDKTGHTYRLPSEAEREYATRAGTSGRFNTGFCITAAQANFNGEEPPFSCPTGIWRSRTVPVATFEPNAFGLFDTHGNVWEWVQDCWNSSYLGAPTDGSAWMTGDCDQAVLRGGSWFVFGRGVRSASRARFARFTRFEDFGFRVVREIPSN